MGKCLSVSNRVAQKGFEGLGCRPTDQSHQHFQPTSEGALYDHRQKKESLRKHCGKKLNLRLCWFDDTNP